MFIAKTPQTEPIPGYRLVEPLGKGGFGEVWKCEAPGGLFKAVKFVSGSENVADSGSASARQELRALQLIKSIRHPYLLTIERIEVVGGEVVIVMELADRSLHDLLVENRAAGQPGIPRRELLGYMREAAEAIDVLNQEYGLQHLDIKPRNLFLIGRHVKVADFGLVTSLSEMQSQSSWLRRSETVTPLYAAPETFLGKFTLFSDQYSLAITYQELLTSSLPFSGRSFRQLAMRHVQEPPDLTAVPEVERAMLARALAKEPRERFPSCMAFVQALLALNDVPAPRPARSQGTHADLQLGELAATPPGTRQVRVVSVPASVPAPPAAPVNALAEVPVEGASPFLAGYRLLECMHRHAAAEVWKAQTTDGRKRLIHLLNGYDPAEAQAGGDPLARLRALRHPCLPPLDIQLGPGGRLALITDAPDGSLSERLRECQQIGQQGVPRPELIACLREAGAALDHLYQEHRLQHLALTPRQLVLRGGQLFLPNFGLAELLWLPAGFDLAALNTRYAAPELFDHQSSRHCDQYSLALIYQELLTGIHAFRNCNQRQMAVARLRGKPDLGLLPATDRAVVLQALHIDPDQRFPTCSAFVDALEGIAVARGPESSLRVTRVQMATVATPLRSAVCRSVAPPAPGLRELCGERPLAEWKQIISEQVASAAGDGEIRVRGPLRYRFRRAASGGRGAVVTEAALEHFSYGRLMPATVRLKLTAFEEEWKVERVRGDKALVPSADTASWLYQVHVGASLWQRCLGRSPALLVQIDLKTPRPTTEALTEVILRVRPSDCRVERGVELLDDLGPRLLESLRDHLQLPADRRSEERFSITGNVQVRPIHSAREIGEGIAAQLRNICKGGLGLDVPCRPPAEFLLVQMSPPHRAPLMIPAKVLHNTPHGDGHYYVGTRFAWEMIQDHTV
jgi:serine/threonine protein kinase